MQKRKMLIMKENPHDISKVTYIISLEIFKCVAQFPS